MTHTNTNLEDITRLYHAKIEAEINIIINNTYTYISENQEDKFIDNIATLLATMPNQTKNADAIKSEIEKKMKK